jgi:CSLREA domain-containing protein
MRNINRVLHISSRMLMPAAVVGLALGSLFASSDPASAGIIILVNTTEDVVDGDGDCSLREAIIAANTNTITDGCGSGVWSGADSIRFQLGSGNPIIQVGATPLPTVTEQVTIAGNTGGATRVTLDGPRPAASTTGLDIGPSATNSTIRFLVVYNFTLGIHLRGAGSVLISSYIGPDSTGMGAWGNGTGVTIGADTVRVGGTSGTTPGGSCTGECNLISGNDTFGISGEFPGTIQGNFIGTDVLGTGPVANNIGVGGVIVLVGGDTPAARNVVSGNTSAGLTTNGGLIRGNYIGTDTTGTEQVENDAGGIVLNGPSEGTIDNNVVSGNGIAGIILSAASNIQIRNNKVGVAADGVTGLQNWNNGGGNGHGVYLKDGAHSNFIGAPGQGNTIASNFGDGVRVEGNTTIKNRIRFNSIHDNFGLGINLVGGGNEDVAPPTIDAIGATSVEGVSCFSCPHVDVYSDGGTEGKLFEGVAVVSGCCDWTYNGTLHGPFVTAAQTNADGSTSEFAVPAVCPDTDGDSSCDGVDPEDDSDGYTDSAEAGVPLCVSAGNDDAFDDAIADDGCLGGPAQAGNFSEGQFKIGTGAQDPCGQTGWPSDVFSSGPSANKLTIQDVISFITMPRKLDTNPGEAGFDSRWDLVPGRGILGKFININDITALVNGTTGNPPMFNNTRAFDKVCPFAP